MVPKWALCIALIAISGMDLVHQQPLGLWIGIVQSGKNWLCAQWQGSPCDFLIIFQITSLFLFMSHAAMAVTSFNNFRYAIMVGGDTLGRQIIGVCQAFSYFRGFSMAVILVS